MFIVVRFPRPWPVHEDVQFFSVPCEAQTLSIAATKDGRLRLLVQQGAEVVATFQSQPIRIIGGGYVLLNPSWRGNEITLRINGREISASTNAGEVPLVISTNDHPVGVTPSFEDPERASACAEWMTWRKRRFGTPKVAPKHKRRLKTLSEQLAELSRATRSLADLAAIVQQGRPHLIGHLATELRALVYWNGKNYSPLLLRLAGQLDIPLPLYALVDQSVPPTFGDSKLHVKTSEAANIIRTLPSQRLCDLQDWLEGIMLTASYASDVYAMTPGQRGDLSRKDLISKVATTMGSAHYDEDLPIDLELLFRIQGGPNSNEIACFLIYAANIVTAMSSHVLSMAATRILRESLTSKA